MTNVTGACKKVIDTITAANTILATGARARKIPNIQVDEKLILKIRNYCQKKGNKFLIACTIRSYKYTK